MIGTVKAQGGGTGHCSVQRGLARRIQRSLRRPVSTPAPAIDAKFVPLIGMSSSPNGRVTFQIECNEIAGEQIYYDARVVTVALSNE